MKILSASCTLTPFPVKAISDAKYETHREKLENRVTAWGNQTSPSGPLETARSFVALFYYNGDTSKLQTRLQPSTVADAQLDAFATGTGFSEWLTHNSGATFTDQGTATIKNYTWGAQTQVAEFFAKRTPFALERPVVVGDGLQFDLTSTGKELKAFYEAEVKSTAETALASQADGASVTLPTSGWYDFPNATYPNIWFFGFFRVMHFGSSTGATPLLYRGSRLANLIMTVFQMQSAVQGRTGISAAGRAQRVMPDSPLHEAAHLIPW